MDARLDDNARAILAQTLRWAIAGSPETVERGLMDFIAHTGADELMVTAQIFDHQARLRSYELLAQAHGRIAAGTETQAVA
jgi:alkanesulfonate monooxygenase SsuD/methylene tetrahydromethanopterin reductase-like flavin-dependent oxidoreductase (luciferase family)